jgi:hypothetical protein
MRQRRRAPRSLCDRFGLLSLLLYSYTAGHCCHFRNNHDTHYTRPTHPYLHAINQDIFLPRTSEFLLSLVDTPLKFLFQPFSVPKKPFFLNCGVVSPSLADWMGLGVLLFHSSIRYAGCGWYPIDETESFLRGMPGRARVFE